VGSQVLDWTVDSRKLNSDNRQIVSPSFELLCGPREESTTFKLIIFPVASKRERSFKQANGKGYVKLKCETPLGESVGNLEFRISIGNGQEFKSPRPPVPVVHNFQFQALCSKTQEQGEQDFFEVEDELSKTFAVRLEVLK